jgi:hypothetical protein
VCQHGHSKSASSRGDPDGRTRTVYLEKEIVTSGYFAVSAGRGGGHKQRVTRLAGGDAAGGRIRSITIEAAPGRRLPGIGDLDRYVAFQEIVGRTRLASGDVSSPVTFRTADLVSVLGRDRANGWHCGRVREWLETMAGTRIRYGPAVPTDGIAADPGAAVRVFERVVPAEALDGDASRTVHQVWFSDWQLGNLRRKSVLRIDLEAYLGLSRPLARGLFPLLHVWFHAARETGRFEKNGDDFCRLVGLPGYGYRSQCEQSVRPALEELRERGWLDAWSIVTTPRGWKLRLVAGSRMRRGRDRAGEPGRDAAASTVPEREVPGGAGGILRELARRGIAEAQARRLIAGSPSHEEMLDTLEWGDHLIRSRSGVENPAGFYVHLIRSHARPPEGFATTRRGRDRDDADRRAEDDGRERARLETAYDECRQQEIDRHIVASVTDSEFRDRLEAKRRELETRFPNSRRFTPEALDRCLRHAVRDEIAATLRLPTFQEYCSHHPNPFNGGNESERIQ